MSRLTGRADYPAVATRFAVRVSALRGPGRQTSIVEARHLAMYLARLHTGLSYAAIGAYFGGRDPATVRHACKATAGRLERQSRPGCCCGFIRQHAGKRSQGNEGRDPMPELPDITVYIEALERQIVGERLERVRVNNPFLVRTFEPPLEAASRQDGSSIAAAGQADRHRAR